MTDLNQRSERRRRAMFATLAVAVTLVVVISEITWIRLDTRLQPVIDEWIEKSLNLADGLASARPVEVWRHIYWASIGPRFPLYPLLAVPTLWFVERSVDAILLVNCASLFVLAHATYRLATRILDARAGFLATALVLLYPATTTLMKLARPHALIPATVALSLLALYELAFSPPSHRRVWFAAFTIVAVFASHAASLATLYGAFLIATLLFAEQLASDVNRDASTRASLHQKATRAFASPILLHSALPAVLVVGIVIGGWLYLKWDQYLGMMTVIREIFRPMSPEWHYETTVGAALGGPSFVLFVCAICGLVVVRPKLQYVTKQGLAFVAASLVSAFVFSHFQTSAKSWQSFAGVLSMFAVLTAVASIGLLDCLSRQGCSPVRNGFWSIATIGVVTATAGLTYATLNWGSDELPKHLTTITGIRPTCHMHNEMACANPPVGGDWFVNEALAIMISDPRCKSATCDIAVLGHRQSYFSDEALAYSVVLGFPLESRLVSRKFYPERNLRFKRVMGDVSDAWRQIAGSQYVLILENDMPERFEYANNSVAGERAIAEAMLRNGTTQIGSFSEVFRRKIPTGESLVVVSRN